MALAESPSPHHREPMVPLLLAVLYAHVEQWRVPAAAADAYYACVRRTWIPRVRERNGNRAVYVLRREEDDAERFVLIAIDERKRAAESPQCGSSTLVDAYVAPVVFERIR